MGKPKRWSLGLSNDTGERKAQILKWNWQTLVANSMCGVKMHA